MTADPAHTPGADLTPSAAALRHAVTFRPWPATIGTATNAVFVSPSTQPGTAPAGLADGDSWSDGRRVAAMERPVASAAVGARVDMLSLFSMKGGVGTSATAVLLAQRSANRRHPSLLVDLCGELEVVAGASSHHGPGVSDWLAAAEAPPPGALAELVIELAPGLSLLPRGSAPLRHHDRIPALLAELAGLGARVIVDCGLLRPAGAAADALDPSDDADRSLRLAVAEAGSTRWLVTRACYLAVRASTASPCPVDGIVLLSEPGRALTAVDVSEAVGAPVTLDIAIDPAVARLVDAGLLLSRVPRALQRTLDRSLSVLP